MSMNEFSHSMNNPLLIYTVLGVYGIVLLLLLAYVRSKFNKAARLLNDLKKDWASADSKHSGFLDHAHEQITRLAAPALATRAPVNHDPVNHELRNQVVTMGRKGITPADIARSCGLPEGEVDVLLGLARMQVTSR